jgi:hypothetical protein
MGINFSVASLHSTIYFYKDGELVKSYAHPGVVTNLGKNMTMSKLTGNMTAYNATVYMYNLTYISIGNQGSLSASSTVLPGEWNRTSATMHDNAYNTFNLTATIKPGTGPYTADCMGVNWESGIAKDLTLWGYDTQPEVTGIDNTFTIAIEIQISVS